MVIESFRWMPHGWVLSLEDPCPVHSITHSESPEDSTPVNFLTRFERFMGITNMNVEVFHILNECLTSLFSVTDHMTNQNVVPANFAFFNNELSHFEPCRKQTKRSLQFWKKRVS